MTTIVLHLPLATVYSMYQLGYHPSSAVARLPGQATAWMTLVVLVVMGFFLTGLGSAARGIAEVFSLFVRLVALVTSTLVITLVVVLAVVALLIHH